MRKRKKDEAPVERIKHYTFLLKDAEETFKHVSIIAPDKSIAEQQLEMEYPHHEKKFLWEYIRRTAADFCPD